jgi:protein-arginine kinase activator protein McsA
MICQFCKLREADLLCNGRLDDGRTCNNSVCRQCAKCDNQIFIHLSRRDQETNSRCSVETVDRCPACLAANRETNWGGMSSEKAIELVEHERSKHRPHAVKGQMPLF